MVAALASRALPRIKDRHMVKHAMPLMPRHTAFLRDCFMVWFVLLLYVK